MIQLKTLRCFLLFIPLSFIFHGAALASNKIVAVINDEVVTQNQLNHVIYVIKQQKQMQGNSIHPSRIRQEALNQLINNKLMLQIAKQNHITTTDAEVNQQIQLIASQNGLSLDKFKQVLLKEGSNFKMYQEFIKNQITLNKLRSQYLGQKIKISENDIKSEMAQAKKMNTEEAPIQILDVTVSPVGEQDLSHAKAATSKIRNALLQGEELQKTLKAFENSNVKITGQDLGWKRLSELPDLFVPALKTLPAGQISNAIEAPNGIHLLIVLNRKGGTISRAEAERMALHKKMQAETEKWLIEVKKQAYIEIKN